MVVISLIIIAMYIILIAWSWHCLENIEKSTKIIAIVIGIFIAYILTLIIFNISKSGLDYKNVENIKQINAVYISIFTAINGYILLPFTYRKMAEVQNNETTKEKLAKSLSALVVAFIVISVMEINYLSATQKGIIELREKNINQNYSSEINVEEK